MSEATPKAETPAIVRRLIGATAIAIAVLCLLALAVWAWRSTSSLRQPPVAAIDPISDKDVQAKRSAFSQQLASAATKIKDRSPFVVPLPPEPPKPKVPPKYAGPALVGVAGGQVFFADGKRIGLGETKDGIEVLSLNAPWSVRLRWSGGEYDVALLDRQPVRFDDITRVKDTLFNK